MLFRIIVIIIIAILLFLLHILVHTKITTNIAANYDKTGNKQYNKNNNNNNYLDGIDIIYWINLNRSSDRRKEMMNIFQDSAFNNIPNERVSAVDGMNPKLVYPKLNIAYKQKNDYEYACTLSHLDTIRTFAQTNYDVALIMEDDITMDFKKYWTKSVSEIMNNAPANWEVIQLCYNTSFSPERFNLYERNINNKCVCAAAYLIKNSAANNLIGSIYTNRKYNLEKHINHHADCYIFAKCITYTYKYPYFIYKTNNTSLLHPEDLMGHELSKSKIINMYENML